MGTADLQGAFLCRELAWAQGQWTSHRRRDVKRDFHQNLSFYCLGVLLVLKVPEGSKQAVSGEFFRVLRKIKRHQLLTQNALSKPRTAQRGISLQGAAEFAYEMDFDYFPVNHFGPWSVEVDQGQPWGSTSEGWERRSETEEPGSHSQGADNERRKEIFLHFVVYRDAIPHGHSTVTLPSCPHLGKAQGSEQRGMGLTLKKHLHGFRALLPGWYCCSLYDIFWAWLAHILNKTWGAGGLWGGRTERKMSDLHPHKESVNNGV